MKNIQATLPPIAVYIHWPFCLSKCPYCDFNSHVAEKINQASYRDAYLKEISHYVQKLGQRTIGSVFFGGGTPSLMEPATVQAILESLADRWNLSDETEVTLEANPTSVEMARLQDFKAAGVNRLSLGIQALNDNDLKFLGRHHNAEGALAALKAAGTVFDNFSFDLIYARPGQTVVAWKKELKTALDLCAYHLSLYQLTIEKGTPFYGAAQRKEFELPDEDTSSELYDVTAEMAARKGLQDYEVSNYATPGYESQHNLAYWRYQPYVGIGPGAHGRIDRRAGRNATMNIHRPDLWLSAVQSKGSGLQVSEPIDGQAYLEEFLLMGLRLKEGISREQFRRHIQAEIEDTLNYKTMQDQKMIVLDKEGIRASPQGRLLLNRVIVELLAE